LLQALGRGATQDTIVERLERDAFARELALGVFVAVEAQLGILTLAAQFQGGGGAV
jgi:hypothetical protein